MEEKTCKYCQKVISINAVKCPYCQEWLNKTSLSWRNPFVFPLVLFAIWITFYALGPLLISKRFKDSSLFREAIAYKPGNKLSLLNERLIKDKTSYRIISEIQNDEAYKWDRVEILAIFNDKQGKPLYLSSAYIYDLKPGEKRLFQIDSPCSEEAISFENFKDYNLQIETASAKPWLDKKE